MTDQHWVAIDSSTDRDAWARRLARAHDRVLSGHGPQPEVRTLIEDSWRRSSRSGVDPSRGLGQVEISAQEAEERWRTSPLNEAEPVLRDLLARVGAEGSQIVLACDRDGTMLWIDGDPGVLDEAAAIKLQRGARWSEEDAGTNAMGTALEAEHALQVFSAEHYAVPVHGWTCSAAPVRDPETGELLGVIDLSGEYSTAHPFSVELLEAAAATVEARLLRRSVERSASLLERFGGRVGARGGKPVALTTAAGRVLVTGLDQLSGARLEVPTLGGSLAPDLGFPLRAEPLDGGGYLIWREGRSGAAGSDALSAQLLGRDRALLVVGGQDLALSPRHSELLLLLSLRPEGMTAERLALELYGERGKPVTVRAELSRLRRILAGAIEANPYRLSSPLDGDHLLVERLVASGRTAEALDRYAGQV
ncbi:MAG: GAF domain-containing protein, partial [Actinomycetota bacterium]|nr:GAF domain-containing protein [Actinomycetota bacterium]